jgi:hypothetical protein
MVKIVLANVGSQILRCRGIHFFSIVHDLSFKLLRDVASIKVQFWLTDVFFEDNSSVPSKKNPTFLPMPSEKLSSQNQVLLEEVSSWWLCNVVNKIQDVR